MSDSDSDSEIPLCAAAAPAPKRQKLDVAAVKTSTVSLEESTAKREAEEGAKRAADDARRQREADAAAEAERTRRAEALAAAAAAQPADGDAPPAATGGHKFVKNARKPMDESTRQKNKRKEKLGQAKFTLKEDRDCPSIWDGGRG